MAHCILRTPTLPLQHPVKPGMVFQSLEKRGLGQWSSSTFPSQTRRLGKRFRLRSPSKSFSRCSSWRFTSFQAPSYSQLDPSLEQLVQEAAANPFRRLIS